MRIWPRYHFQIFIYTSSLTPNLSKSSCHTVSMKGVFVLYLFFCPNTLSFWSWVLRLWMSTSQFLSLRAHCGHRESHLFDQSGEIFGKPLTNKSSGFHRAFSKPHLGTRSYTPLVLPMMTRRSQRWRLADTSPSSASEDPLRPVDLGVSPKGPASLPSPSVDSPNASVMD